MESVPGEAYECSAAHPDVVIAVTDAVMAKLATFPARVQSAWADTQARRTDYEPTGALPVIAK